ncbi:MAG: SDR family oxidoreductase [Alphaproteobacteria bacterium]|nr:SDR family oxidoreductase [Alphaproteobacteria bacterium]
MSKALQGKVALVTGGSRGIGAAIARRLAADGADVIFSYVSSADKANALVSELEKTGVRAAAFAADQADAQQVTALVQKAAKHFGRLDILINNAGVAAYHDITTAEADEAALERQFAINVHAVATAVRAAVPHLPKGGRIVSIGSVLGERSPIAAISGYSATKAAIAGYTRGWARDLGPRGITVNVVNPGLTDTDMNPDEGDFADAMKKNTALGRYGTPAEIAAAVVFLAGPEASYITGVTLNVDGGINA